MAANMNVYKTREEWIKARTSYIGGSDAAAVLGLNPYMTNQELWKIKTGKMKQEDISDKPYVQYGVKAEYHLRELFKLDFPDLSVSYEENNMWMNEKYPYAHASLDGWFKDPDGKFGILEIKTTEILRSMQKEKWHDQIPENYYIQVLHYMMVTEADRAILKAQLKYDYSGEIFLQIRHYYIDRSEVEEDIKILAEAESKFSKAIESGECPPLILPEI